MDQGIQGGKDRGGIISLAKFSLEHREAMEYDLLTKTGHEFIDIGRTLSWDALDSFLQFIGPDSALFREKDPELARWATTLKTNEILADIWDVLSAINNNLVAIGSRKPAKKYKPYPRPWKKNEDTKKIGSDALPVDELEKWMEEKREQHARNSAGDHNSHPSSAGGSTENNE